VRQARVAAPPKNVWLGTRGVWQSEVGDLSLLLVLTVRCAVLVRHRVMRSSSRCRQYALIALWAIGHPPASAKREWASSQGVLCQPSVFGLQYAVSAQGILRRSFVLCRRGAGRVQCILCLRSAHARANVGVEPKGELRVVCTRSPVLTHSPVQPVPALWRVQAKVVIQPGGVVPRLRPRAVVLLHSPVHPVPPPVTRPPVGLPSLVGPVAAPRTRLSLRLLHPCPPVCPELPEPPVCPELPEPPVCPELPEPPVCPELPESPISQELPEPPTARQPGAARAARQPSAAGVSPLSAVAGISHLFGTRCKGPQSEVGGAPKAPLKRAKTMME
jgi:hypothetical protein